jgi:hypothetical protein
MVESMQMLALMGAGAAGALMLFKVVCGAYRLAKRVEAVHDAVLTELLPNGGSTLVDRVGALERDFGEYRDDQDHRWILIQNRLGLNTKE